MELESRLESDVTSARHRTPGLDEPWPCWAWPWANRRGAEWTCADAAAGQEAGGCAFPISPILCRYRVKASASEFSEGRLTTGHRRSERSVQKSGREQRARVH